MTPPSDAHRAFLAEVAKARSCSVGFHPLTYEVTAASKLLPAVDAEILRIGTADNRNLNLIPEVRTFLATLFPTGVTPSGIVVDDAGIRAVAQTNFTFYC
jgi:hypothetical protein